jgi:L-2,4-diaminobutyrate decarboxylase
MTQSPTHPPTPLYSGATPEQVAADLAPLLAFEEAPMPLEEVQTLVTQTLLPHLMRYDLPHFQSMFNAAPEPGALLGGRIALETNQGVTNWQVSPGGAMLEELCGRALCRLFGLNPGADATFMYAGTYANQQALYMALHRFGERAGVDLAQEGVAGLPQPEKLAILISGDAHFSFRHAARMLGLGERSLIPLPVDRERRIDLAASRRLLAEKHGDRAIVCVVGTSGTTSTGAIDPLDGLADLAEESGAWFHVDGAYGYAYALVPAWADRFAGAKRADSITWDPHKQMGVPIPNSVLFARDGRDFGRMALYSGYFNQKEVTEPNPGLKSPPSTRPLSALPLVTSIRARGLGGVVADLAGHLHAIQELADAIDHLPDVERLHTPDTGILCFRITPAHLSPAGVDELQPWLYQETLRRGERTVSLTTLDGRPALRLLAVSPQVTGPALIETVDYLRGLGGEQQFQK